MLYNHYDLQRNDDDATSCWGGEVRAGKTPIAASGKEASAAPSCAATSTSTLPSSSSTLVHRLQTDLRELGFRVVPVPDGTFDLHTEWGVREFQVYAKMPFLAREVRPAARYIDRLEQVRNDHIYKGPISGVVNAETRECIELWLAQKYRCPVVVEARTIAQGVPAGVKADNLWLHDQLPDSQPRMYVRDFSGYYPFPAGRDPSALIVLGDFQKYLSWSGPRSVPPNHVFRPEAELLPENLVGHAIEHRASSPEFSTFKVVRAVSEVECIGYFDSVNSYDNAFVSQGPCHWTLGIVSGTGGSVSSGELCGFLSYLREANRQAFIQAFEFFGASIDEAWGGTGRDLFSPSGRKYTGWVTLQREDGQFAPVPRREADGNYFKTWHWFYRFVMAGRTLEGYRRAMWTMARIRLRDLRTMPWGTDIANLASTGAPPTVADVFTSERSWGILLRWHVRFPGHVASAAGAGPRLRSAFRRAQASAPTLDWNGSPDAWTTAHEQALLTGLRNEVQATGNSSFIETINAVDLFPNYPGRARRKFVLTDSLGSLLTDRASFVFDLSGLPPPP